MPRTPVRPRLWTPTRVLVTAAAAEYPHAQEIVRRCEAAGVEDIQLLSGNRVTGLRGKDDRATYVAAKATLAVVVSAPSKRRLEPIPPSADWRFDLAEGCPAHCQYCYLAGSLSGPPVTRVFADLDDILAGLGRYVGHGGVTSTSAERAAEGTTFEASCYTDPLGIEHLTGSLSAAIGYFGGHRWDGPVGLRATTKFDEVAPLLGLAHGGRTRLRFSVNSAAVAGRFEGGTAPVARRLQAMRSVALAGYPVGLTIAPIMPLPGWREEYADLLDQAAAAVEGIPGADLTVECITHRFTPNSKQTLTAWYPNTKLDMAEENRTLKRGRFGAVKHVYPRAEMAELRRWFDAALAERLPAGRLLYWT